MGRHIRDYTELDRLHTNAMSPYGGWVDMCDKVDDLFKGDFSSKPHLEDADTKIAKPSQPRNILMKFVRMLGVRSDINIQYIPRNDTQAEMGRVDKVERALRAFTWYHDDLMQTNTARNVAFFAALRGRGPIHTRYEPDRADLKIRRYVYDPLEVFPHRINGRIDYFTRERYMSRFELEEYFASLPAEQVGRMEVPPHLALIKQNEVGEEVDPAPYDMFRVIEYWDDEYCAWSVDSRLMEVFEHGYGFQALSEARFNETPLDDEKWASQGILYPVLDDLKQIAILQQKMADSVEAFFWPTILFKSADGSIASGMADQIGEWAQIANDSQIEVVKPTSNHEELALLMQQFQKNVDQGTIPPAVFAADLNSVSGFAVNQVIAAIKDDIADYQHALERTLARDYANILRLWERFGDEQEDGGFWLPMSGEDSGRKQMDLIRPEDIDGHYHIRVSVKVDLPTDMVQKATTFNQFYQLDQQGRPRMDFMTAVQLSGLDESIEDVSAMKDRIDWAWARTIDPEVQQLELARIKAHHLRELEGWEKDIQKAERRQEKRDMRETQREIERGLSDDLIVPGEIMADPQRMTRYVMLLEEGLSPQAAMERVQADDLPLGAPGEAAVGGAPTAPQGEVSPETAALVSQLFGGATQPMPDGFTGYEGVAPAALPPAMQGAQPRQTMDQARLEQETLEDDMMRGGLPDRR